MKSKKSIFVVALAALMLIAFTACEQAPIVMNPNGKIPTNVVITQTGDFVTGQQFDSSKFAVSFAYENTDALQPVNDANIVFEGSVVSSNSKVSVTVDYVDKDGNQAKLSASKTINAYPISDLTITGTVAPSWNGTAFDKEIKTSDLTVVTNYLDANRTKQSITLDPSEYKLHSTPALADGETAPSAEGETAVYEQTVYVTFGDSKKTSSDNYGTGVYTFTAAYVDDTVTSEYEWFNHQIVYAQVPAKVASDSSAVAYVQRGEFNPETMIKLYKVFAPKGATILGDDYYLVEMDQADSSTEGYFKPVMTLANPYTNSAIKNLGTNRFAQASTANVNFSMKYTANEGTGAYATKTSIDGYVEIEDLDAVAAADFDDSTLPKGLVDGKTYAGDITSASTMTIRNIIADYPLTVSVTVNATLNTTGKGVAVGTEYSDLVGAGDNSIIKAVVASWKSGVGLKDQLLTSYGTLSFDPEVAENDTEAETTANVKWEFAPTLEYSDSYVGMAAFKSTTDLSIVVAEPSN